MLKLPTSEIVLRAGFQSNVSLLSTLLLVSANPHQRQDLLDRVLQDRSLQYLNQLYLDKTENATSLFEEIKSYLSATGSGFKLVIDRKPCGDNMDMASKLNSITAEIEKVIPGDSLVSPHFLSLLVALNTHPDVSSLQTLSAVQLVFGHPHVVADCEAAGDAFRGGCRPISTPFSHRQDHFPLAPHRRSPFLVDNGCHFATVEARYEYSLTLARTGYNSSSTVTLRLNKNEEVLKSNSCSNVKSREISPLSVLNADDALDRLTKSFSEMPVPSSSPPVPARLDLNQDASMMMQGDQVTDTRNMPSKPQTLVGPTVTITSELSPTEEPGKWAPLGSSRYFGKYRAKPNLASDAEVQDIVDFLSGCPPKQSTGSLLDPPNKSPQDSITPNSSSSSSSNHSSGWGSLGGGDSNAIRYGSYNPQYQELDSQYGGRKSPMPHGHHWTGQPYQTHSQMGQMYVPDPRMMGDPTNEAEFAHYVAANAIVKRVPLTSECSPTHMHGGHWSPPQGIR
ncbi:hypothetical protein BSL78_15406 [Apostichopus japonicus]|uniref:Uncharacterized protein n=1 Tax=Stichopus japonicus TaxID=307972 RepID=A0A2G8KIB4_STIJA|nr:hypothetical protein BSL78_15406 [Apostichopus japonicus]